MANIEFQLHLFGPELNKEYTQVTILLMTEMLTRINVKWLDENPTWPHLYKSGIRYREDMPGKETMKDLPTMLDDGWGDCASLGPARCAELRVAASKKGGAYAGFRFTPWIRWRKTRDDVWRFHVLCRWILPNGQVRFEDPSRTLGMGA